MRYHEVQKFLGQGNKSLPGVMVLGIHHIQQEYLSYHVQVRHFSQAFGSFELVPSRLCQMVVALLSRV
jgi:predicted MPP superfamily phosphohydrolase